MPTVDDHPIRLARLKAGLTQEQLAFEANVSRSTICQIEEGRSKSINRKVIDVLATKLEVPPQSLRHKFEQWRDKPGAHRLDTRAHNALALPPEFIKQYRSFKQWRGDVAPSTNALASMLKTNRAQLVKYEDGEIAMPKAVYHGLIREFNLSDEYVDALMALDERQSR